MGKTEVFCGVFWARGQVNNIVRLLRQVRGRTARRGVLNLVLTILTARVQKCGAIKAKKMARVGGSHEDFLKILRLLQFIDGRRAQECDRIGAACHNSPHLCPDF